MADKTKYPKLMEPGYIGKVRTRNRIVRMGAFPGFAPYEGGFIQQYYYDFYTSLAKGGVGLLTVSVSPVGAPPGRGYQLNDDKYIPRIKEMNEEIHKYGCPTFVQLFHIGPWLPAPLTEAASSIPEKEMPTTLQNFPDAKALTIDEIKGIVRTFGDFAVRARKAGFDGAEINAGCTHLLSTFLSRVWNRRTDEYGYSSLENRARFVVEIVKEIKERAGKDFAIDVLFNAAEPGIENGITIEESRELAKLFEAAGADAIHARVEFYVTRKATQKHDSTHFPDVAFYPETPSYAAASGVDTKHHGVAGWAPLAAEIKKAVRIPVIAVGRLDPDTGEKLLKWGAVDFINMNRRLLADHELPNKIAEGRYEDIAPCTACLTCFCVNELGNPLKCRINASLGREREYEITPAAKKKNVVVIGSGPAGMEAARVAALRGHKVTLFEKEPMVGGAMNLAAVVKGTEREDLLSVIDYLKTQITKVGVDIRLGKEATKETVAELKPDVVIVATGGKHNIPAIPGIERKNVFTSEALHHQLKSYLKITGARLMTKLATKYIPVGKNVVVMGGNVQGCQTAEFLAKRGRKVTIVEAGPEIGEGLLPILMKPQLLDWLDKKEVPMMAEVKYGEITDKGLTVTTKEGKQQTIAADTVLTALPLQPDTSLYDSLKGVAPEVFVIGDAKQPGLIVDAIQDGACVGREI
ncbi:MAG: NAD(P)/FAD-dependent oxidoreductase [Dehalococcoidia bacterium]|nr:NAD(P)/FAD-dependent oxidoreductase [Dehalococcoidia bacterium]